MDPARFIGCHCALGCMDQVLTACGVDVDRELPWFKPWFERYQMRDGGLNCDESAYLVDRRVPELDGRDGPALEAMLRRGAQPVRRSRGAVPSRARARPRLADPPQRRRADAAQRGARATFPRFYFYDVLRGATALHRYAALVTDPAQEPAPALVRSLAPDGVVRVGRRAWETAGTWDRDPSGAWVRLPLAHRFPLSRRSARSERASDVLTREWLRLASFSARVRSAGTARRHPASRARPRARRRRAGSVSPDRR